jgi:hypothetical protein
MYADAESALGRMLIIIAALPDYNRSGAPVPGCRVVTFCGVCINPAAPRPWRCRICRQSRGRREPGWCRLCTPHAAGHGISSTSVRAGRVRGRAAQGGGAAADCRRPGRAEPRIGRLAGRGGSREITLLAGRGTCGTHCAGRVRWTGLTGRPRVTRHSGSGCWRGSSSRLASRTACGSWGDRD